MLLFKDYISFKKENRDILELIKNIDAYTYDINPILYVLDLLSELNDNQKDDDLDFKNVINIFEVGFNYLKIYINFIEMLITVSSVDVITDMADEIAFYIELSNYQSFLHNAYEDRKIKHLLDFDDFVSQIEDSIVNKKHLNLDDMRSSFVDILDIIEKDNNIEIPTEELYVPGAFEILYDEIENDATYEI